MKQTAVEWLKDQLECFGNKHELTISWTTVDELVEQAKEMEKEQIIDAWDDGAYGLGMTPNAWDLSFIRKLQIEIGKLPYHQGLDDGGFNDGLAQGFEQGAQWVWDNFKLEIK